MSQFQVFPTPGSQDPVSQFSQWGNPFSQARSRGSRPVPLNSGGPSNQAQRQFVPYTGSMGYAQPSIDPLGGRTNQNLRRPQPMNPFVGIDQTIAGSVGFDMSRQQAAADYQFGRLNQATEGFMGATEAAAGRMEQVGGAQRQAMQGIAGGLEQQGQKDFDAFTKFRDQQLGGVNQRLDQMGSQMQAAVDKAADVERQFRDTSAQDAANAGFGIGRNAAARAQEIDMMDLSPGEKAALKQQNWMDTQTQTTQAVTGIFSNMNQQVAQLGQMTASMRQAQAGMTAQGAQIAGQVGTAFGAQTLEAQKMGQQMRELGSNIRVMGEQAYASLSTQAAMLLASGQRERYDMYMNNPYQPISVFAGLTGFLNAATTPGIENINLPDFRGYT
jgi:hypothetical protein